MPNELTSRIGREDKEGDILTTWDSVAFYVPYNNSSLSQSKQKVMMTIKQGDFHFMLSFVHLHL